MPGGLKPIKPDANGNTGLWNDYISPFPESNILGILQSTDYGNYITDVWDCEQRAYWGISRVRCELQGCPIGAAIGKALDSTYTRAAEMHTLIVYWKHLGDHNYQSIYFDPALKRPINFEPHIIIPFPVLRPGQPGVIRKEFPPFEDNRIISGYLALNKEYTFVNAATVISYLKNIHKCQIPDGPIKKRFSEDRALWAANHVRREFAFNQGGISLPVGEAFGSVPSNDKGAIVIMERPNKAVFLDADKYEPSRTLIRGLS